MNCILIDDEPLARQGMRLLIDKIPNIEITAEFPNPILANEYLKTQVPDLIFLDIEMPGINGIDFLKTLNIKTNVILCTAYPQFALEAFELDVIDYLVKPIDFNRFFKAVEKAHEIHKLQSQPVNKVEDIGRKFIYIKSERKYFKIRLQDIQYIKGLKDYVIVHTETSKYITAMNLKTILTQLPQDLFARINKSTIINVDLIKEVEIDSIIINKKEFSLGNSYKDQFLNTHIKNKLISRK